MLSDEEKKAIKDCDHIFICLDDCMSEDSANDYRKSYKILKNLIEKQSKEIEELKKGYKIQEHNYQVAMEEIEQRYIDKIKAKIEYYEKIDNAVGVRILESLLEKE